MKKRILYVCYGGGHVNMMFPLYEKLSADTNIEQIFLALTTATIKLKELQIPYITFENFLDNDTAALDYGEKLLGKSMNKMIPDSESRAYLGLSYRDLVSTHGESKAAELYEQYGRQAFLPMETMEKIFETLQPDLVMATNSPRAEKAALLQAKAMNIPSLCLVDLYDLGEIKDRLSISGYGSKICVLNPFVKKALIEHGRPESEIVVTGNPAFDVLFSEDYVRQSQSYLEMHNIANKKIVLWARSALPKDVPLADAIENTLVEYAMNHEDVAVIVRPHPNEPPRDLPDHKNVIQSDRSEKLPIVLAASDIVVTLYSTVGVEGFLLGKKVLQYADFEQFESVNYVKQGMVTAIYSTNDLIQEIEKTDMMTSNVSIKKILATDNILKVIRELL